MSTAEFHDDGTDITDEADDDDTGLDDLSDLDDDDIAIDDTPVVPDDLDAADGDDDDLEDLADADDQDSVEDDEEADDDEEDEDEDDEAEAEESLDVLLAREKVLDDDLDRLGDDRDGLSIRPALVGAGEFTCRSCYLVKRRAQLADEKRMLCYDCV